MSDLAELRKQVLAANHAWVQAGKDYDVALDKWTDAKLARASEEILTRLWADVGAAMEKRKFAGGARYQAILESRKAEWQTLARPLYDKLSGG
jgi:hypothetical protein